MRLRIYDIADVISILLQVLGLGLIMDGLDRITCISISIAVAPLLFDQLFWLVMAPRHDIALARLVCTKRMTSSVVYMLCGMSALLFMGPYYKPIMASILGFGGVLVLVLGVLHLLHNV